MLLMKKPWRQFKSVMLLSAFIYYIGCANHPDVTKVVANKADLADLFNVTETITIKGNAANPIYSTYNTYVSKERIYVPDIVSHCVHVFNKSGEPISVLGARKGTASAEFQMPYGVLLDEHGYLYVNDRGNKRIQVFDQNMVLFSQYKFTISSPIETILLSRKSNIILVAVAPAFLNARRQRCLFRELDKNGNTLNIFGPFNQKYISYSWAVTIDAADNIYICNVFEKTIYIFGADRKLSRKIRLKSPSFVTLETHVSRSPKTLSDYVEKSKALSQEPHTKIIRIHAKSGLLIVLNMLSGGPFQEPKYILDIFDLQGNLLYYGIEVPGDMPCYTNKLYCLEYSLADKYGLISLTGLELKPKIPFTINSEGD